MDSSILLITPLPNKGRAEILLLQIINTNHQYDRYKLKENFLAFMLKNAMPQTMMFSLTSSEHKANTMGINYKTLQYLYYYHGCLHPSTLIITYPSVAQLHLWASYRLIYSNTSQSPLFLKSWTLVQYWVHFIDKVFGGDSTLGWKLLSQFNHEHFECTQSVLKLFPHRNN